MEPINKTIEEVKEEAPAPAAPAPAAAPAPVEPTRKKLKKVWNIFCMADTTVAVIVSVAAMVLMYFYISTPAGIIYLLRATNVQEGLSTERQSMWSSPASQAEAQKIKAIVALEKILDLHGK